MTIPTADNRKAPKPETTSFSAPEAALVAAAALSRNGLISYGT